MRLDKLSQVFIIENHLSFIGQKVLLLEINAVLQRSSYQDKRVVEGGVANHYVLLKINVFPALWNINGRFTIAHAQHLCSFLSLELDRLSHSMRRSAIIFLVAAESLCSFLISLLCFPFEPWSSIISSCNPQASFYCRGNLSSGPGFVFMDVSSPSSWQVSRRRSVLREVPKYLFQSSSDCRERLDVT